MTNRTVIRTWCAECDNPTDHTVISAPDEPTPVPSECDWAWCRATTVRAMQIRHTTTLDQPLLGYPFDHFSGLQAPETDRMPSRDKANKGDVVLKTVIVVLVVVVLVVIVLSFLRGGRGL